MGEPQVAIKPSHLLIAGVLASALLTGAVWLLGGRLHGVALLPDQGPSWYVWKLPEPTVWTRLSAWGGYLSHQIFSWGMIYYAQTHLRSYAAGVRRVNLVALLGTFGFIVLHQVQSQLFYDGLAQDVSIFSSQGSVILLIVVVLLMENRRRGMFFGRRAPIKAEIVSVARKYHGYLFSWAVIYTFWYHPMMNTSGHLIGFFYMFLLLIQSSLFFTRAHVNRWWTATLELLVLVHGTLVAIMQAGVTGFWPMFCFGFSGVFVVTQLHGLGLSRRSRTVVSVLIMVSIALTYAWRGYDKLNEVVRIPIIEYAMVGVLALLIWSGLAIARRVRPSRAADPVVSPLADHEEVSPGR